jgi:hypothetical protein
LRATTLRQRQLSQQRLEHDRGSEGGLVQGGPVHSRDKPEDVGDGGCGDRPGHGGYTMVGPAMGLGAELGLSVGLGPSSVAECASLFRTTLPSGSAERCLSCRNR